MKNIVLCSDGTGNKGGYGADSNVYKTYKATRVFDCPQYSFYDQGVGTDKSENVKNKYWVALSGAFGFGFRANVLNLYHFLVRSYKPGDAIFLFGFSRGAATVRAFAGFVNACGLIDKKCLTNPDTFDNDLKNLVENAFECYRQRLKNPKMAQDFKQKYAVKDKDHAPDGNLEIKFVGVWDTVSALGFPDEDFSIVLRAFGKLARKVADIVPSLDYKFYDYKLNDSIKNAYHAISIDDERNTFKPLIWDERNFPNHVEQVWFAGVHSNVGGGYPRTGLSDVALRWMLYKAQALGLLLHPDHLAAIESGMNVYDKLYDSRDGFAIYYSYGPRNLDDLCQVEDTQKYNFIGKVLAMLCRDDKAGKKKQGSKLQGNIALHITAYNKMKEPSDSYTPDGMPPVFDVVDIDVSDPTFPTIIKRHVSAKVAVPPWDALETSMKKLIQARKCLYVAFVESTMAILLVACLLWKFQPQAVAELTACELNQVQIVQTDAPAPPAVAAMPFKAYEQKIAMGDSEAPPKFCEKANDRPLKPVGDFLRYLTPVFLENFITYVVEVQPWIVAALLGTAYYMLRKRRQYIDELNQICAKLCQLL